MWVYVSEGDTKPLVTGAGSRLLACTPAPQPQPQTRSRSGYVYRVPMSAADDLEHLATFIDELPQSESPEVCEHTWYTCPTFTI